MIRYISDILNIHWPIFFITAGIINLDLIVDGTSVSFRIIDT